jgi:hypothetical protein
MRATVTLDDDVIAALRAVMRKRELPFTGALNSAVRSGPSANSPECPYRVTPCTAQIHRGVGVGKINRLLSAWEDDDILRKLELGK